MSWRTKGKNKFIAVLTSIVMMLQLIPFAVIATPDTVPVGQWHFDEGVGTTAVDSSGNNNNGTIGGATWIDGKVGKALNFDGVNDYVEIPYNAALNPKTALTVEAWVNPSINKAWQRIVSKSAYPNTDYSLFRGDKNNIAISVKIGSIARTVYSPENSVPIGAWTYVAGTYDGTSLKLYINGKQVGCIAISGEINAHAEALRIGGDPAGDYFKGMIDEVSIYNKALTATEILSRYQAVTQPDTLAVPANISVVANVDSISIAWEAVANATGYDVEADGEIRDNGNSTIFEHSGLTDKGIEHSYRIRAKNRQVIGEWSEIVTGTITGSVFISELVCDNQYVHCSDVVNINAIVKSASENDVLSYSWSVDGGQIAGDKENISWTAPDEFGVYTITLKVENSKGESDTKSVLVNVMPYTDTINPFDLLEPLEDNDGDGLINSQEIELGTSPWNIDTDSDGVNDAQELELGTNPCEKDTDGDGVDDGAELELGTDPLTNDILPDQKFTITREVSGENNASVSITGEGNIFYNTFLKSDNPLFCSFKNMIGIPVVLTSTEQVEKAVVKIKYNSAELQNKGIVENDLRLFKFDNVNKVFVPVMNSTVDLNGKYVIGEDNSVQEYQTYYIAADPGFISNKPSVFDVTFALDMTQNLHDVDADFTCREGLKNLLESLPDYSSVSVIRSSPAIEVLEPETTDKDVIKYCFEDLRYKPYPGNSDLCSLVDKGIQVLSEGPQNNGKVLFILSSSYNDADQTLLKAKIQSAREKGIVVYFTGFANDLDDYNSMELLAEVGCGRLSVAINADGYDLSLGEVRHDFNSFIPTE